MTDSPVVSREQPLFILGQYRGGTTILQRVLNSYDDVLITGEHWGVLEDLARLYRKGKPPFVESANEHLDVDDVHKNAAWNAQSWLSFVTPDGWQWLCRSFVRDMCYPVFERSRRRIWGFKEIRYPADGNDETLDVLAELFPDALFAFITRHPANALASAAFAKHDQEVTPDVFRYLCTCWRDRTAAHKEFYDRHPEKSFWLRYEEMILGEGDIHALLSALGKTLGDTQRQLLQDIQGRGSSFTDLGYNERWKLLSDAQLQEVDQITGDIAAILGYAEPK